jgi:hypothetical protein
MMDVKAGSAEVVVVERIEAEQEKAVLNRARRRVGCDA